jgi:hypothetical protein
MLQYLLKAAQLHCVIKLSHGGLLLSGEVLNRFLNTRNAKAGTVYLNKTIYLVDENGIHAPKSATVQGMKLRGVL